MTTPADREYALTIIAKFTRGDHTQWQNVAAVLGRCIEDVKREYDLAVPPIPEDLPQEFIIEPSPSFYPRLRAKVLCFLTKGPSAPENIAPAVGMRTESVRARLSELHSDGYVLNDGAWGRATSRTWSLTPEGRSFAETITSPRSPSKAEIAA